jgi:hypothetical protein
LTLSSIGVADICCSTAIAGFVGLATAGVLFVDLLLAVRAFSLTRATRP